ncbi:MAG: CAP domain-containing protein [Cyanobacteria bacterium J06639_14]
MYSAIRAVVLPWLGLIAAGNIVSTEAKPVLPMVTTPVSLAQVQEPAISEDAILSEINRLRSDPAAYADWLETTRGYYDGTVLRWPGQSSIQLVEGTLALNAAIATLRQTDPLPLLELSAGMSQAAEDHVKDLLRHSAFSLRGSDGSTVAMRVSRYGTFQGNVQELVSEGFSDPVGIVASLVIDDGNTSRSYRQTLLREDFRYLGVGCEPREPLTLCVTDFASVYTEAGDIPSTPLNEPMATGGDPFTQPLTSAILATLADDIIAETNAVRTDPAGYAAKLEALRPYYQGTLIKLPGQPIIETVEGVAALDEAIAALQATAPLTALTVSPGLTQGAADHADDIGPQGGIGHYGLDGSAPLERATRYGRVPPGNLLGENISFGAPTLAAWHVMQLLVDDDVPDRGHREAMLRPNYQFTGSACAPHAVFRIVCVMTYASAYDE